MMATADNAEAVYLNGEFIGSDGVLEGPYLDEFEWGTVLPYDVTSQMVDGDNKLTFIVRNYVGGALATSNPTGFPLSRPSTSRRPFSSMTRRRGFRGMRSCSTGPS